MSIYLPKKRRLINCVTGKITTECFDFVPKRHRIHRDVCKQVIDKLRDTCSMTSVAKEFNISTSTVMRYFYLVYYPGLSTAPNVKCKKTRTKKNAKRRKIIL